MCKNTGDCGPFRKQLKMTRMMSMNAGQWWEMGLELRAHQEGFGSYNKSTNKIEISQLQIV